jgi:predicted nuclease of predicted toxin-antitoxin system
MKIKLDGNLPRGLVQVLSGFGHDVDTVIEEGLAAANDDAVWRAAQRAGRLLGTQDLDFSSPRSTTHPPRTHTRSTLLCWP